jgi:hypothetical protein
LNRHGQYKESYDFGFEPIDLSPLKVTDFEVVNLGTPIRSTDKCVMNK